VTPRNLPTLPGGELTDGIVSLRPMTAADAAEVHPVRSSPDVVAYTVTRVAPTAAETADYCARAQAVWREGRSVRLTVRDAATGAFAGKAGLQIEEPGSTEAEIDYYLAAAWRGRGYATRAVTLLCRWALRDTPIERLVAAVHVTNPDSQRVLTRTGFVRDGQMGGLYTYALTVTPPRR